MRYPLALLLVLAATGCASSQSRPNDVLAALDRDLSHAIGTTTVTSAELVKSDAILATAMELPEDRMSLSQVEANAAPTWGATAELVPVPDSR